MIFKYGQQLGIRIDECVIDKETSVRLTVLSTVALHHVSRALNHLIRVLHHFNRRDQSKSGTCQHKVFEFETVLCLQGLTNPGLTREFRRAIEVVKTFYYELRGGIDDRKAHQGDKEK